jgi:NitT/TauT family transport system permease protein
MPSSIYINSLRLLVLALLITFWELASGGLYPGFELLPPLIIGRPSLIIGELINYVTSELFIIDLSSSLQATAWGLLIGMLSGIALGVAFGYVKFLEDLFKPFFVAINSLPRPALAPILTIWFGFGILSKIMVAWSIVFFIAFFNTLQGIKSIDPDLIKAVRVMGADRLGITLHVTIPAVATWAFAALRVSVSFALIGTVIGEFVGAHSGLGYRLLVASGLFKTNLVYAILIILMLLGVMIVRVSEYVESKILKWRPPSIMF